MDLQAKMTLMLNVEPAVMRFVARTTQATILTNVNQINFQPQLGKEYCNIARADLLVTGGCEKFSVRTAVLTDGSKQLLSFFEVSQSLHHTMLTVWAQGCKPELGCTIFLRGSEEIEELKAVRRVLRFLSYVANSLRIEVLQYHMIVNSV